MYLPLPSVTIDIAGQNYKKELRFKYIQIYTYGIYHKIIYSRNLKKSSFSCCNVLAFIIWIY